MKNEENPLKVAIHGMDSRSVKTIMLFFQGPCKGAAIVVNAPEDADADIFDADVPVSKRLLEEVLQKGLLKPAIVLSLNDIVGEGVLCLKKPVKTGGMQQVLARAKAEAAAFLSKTAPLEIVREPGSKVDDFDFFNDELFEYITSTTWDDAPKPETSPQILRTVTAPEPTMPKTDVVGQAEDDNKEEIDPVPTEGEKLSESGQEFVPVPESEEVAVAEMPEQPLAGQARQELKTFGINPEHNKTSKLQTAMRLDEKGFHRSIGLVEDDDLNDHGKLINAHYDPKEYFQGYLQSAINLSRAKGQALVLKTRWCPVVLLGRTQEVWLDSSDSELKEFAGLKLKHKTITTKISISPLDPKKIDFGGALDKFQSMDAFLWKLTCWTSKGRYPVGIDYDMPVYLKNWPNFTRLLITPHALRIAALLIQGPRTMVNIAETLNIKPQYVFIFISAAHALGCVGQTRRLSDSLIQPAGVLPNKDQGVLSRIMNKLRFPIA